MLTKPHWYVISFSALYLLLGGIFFARDFNLEFIIYVVVIVVIFKKLPRQLAASVTTLSHL